MPATHNAPVVIASSKKLYRRIETAGKNATNNAAMTIQKAIQAEIPPPRGAGNFPGYAAKGTLRGDVIVRKAVQNRTTGGMFASGFRATVQMDKRGKSRKYQLIHEYGGIIRPKRANYLVFPEPPGGAPRNAPIPGNKAFQFFWKGRSHIAAKAVRIKAKHYWRDGFNTGIKRARNIIPNEMSRVK